jgi:SAM-dependent methyltransferase
MTDFTAKEIPPRGRLQSYLTLRRAVKAHALVPAGLRKGRVLDIGCGFFRYFPEPTGFGEKYGLDKGISRELRMELKTTHDMALVDVDLECSSRIPFAPGFFDVVIMLALFPRIEPARVVRIVQEVERILRPDGVFIMTTPAKWTRGAMRLLARSGMAGKVRADEQKAVYSRKEVRALLQQGGFSRSAIRSGYSEFFMNIWARARKEDNRFELEEL